MRRVRRIYKVTSKANNSSVRFVSVRFVADKALRNKLEKSGSIEDLINIGVQLSDKIKSRVKDDEGRAVASLMKISFESAKESIPNSDRILIKNLGKKKTKKKIFSTFLKSRGSDYYLVSQPLIEQFKTDLWDIIEPTNVENKQPFFNKFNSNLSDKARSNEDILKSFQWFERPNGAPIVIDKIHVHNLATDLASNNYDSIIRDATSLKPPDYSDITKAATFYSIDKHRMLRTAIQLEQAFDLSKASISDPLSKLKLQDMHNDISNIKNMLLAENVDLSEGSLQESIDKFMQKLEDSRYTHDYLQSLGTDEKQLMNSLDINENQDGSLDIKWKRS